MQKILTDVLIKGKMTTDDLELVNNLIKVNSIDFNFPAKTGTLSTQGYVDEKVDAITLTAGDGITVDGKKISVNKSLVAFLAEPNTFTNTVSIPDAVADDQAASLGQVKEEAASAAGKVKVTAGTGISANGMTVAIDTAVVPQLGEANTFTGDVTFTNKITGSISGSASTLDGLTASIAELNYTKGVTSNIQTQLNAKQDTLTFSTGLSLSDATVTVDPAVVATLAGNNTFVNPVKVPAPVDGTDAANKAFVEGKIATSFTSSETLTATQKAIADYVATQLVGEMSFKDVFDASAATDFSGLSFPAKKGDFYIVSGLTAEKEIGGLKLENNDLIIFREDVDSFAALTVSSDIRLVENADATIVRTTGDQAIKGIKTFESAPVVPYESTTSQVASIAYVAAQVAAAKLTAGAGINISGNEISVIDYAKLPKTDAANTFSGANSFTGTLSAQAPTDDSHVVIKSTMDSELAKKQDKLTTTAQSGITVNGAAISVDNSVVRTTGGNTVSGENDYTAATLTVSTPTEDAHVANKGYVDSSFTSYTAAHRLNVTNEANSFAMDASGNKASWTINHTLNTSDVIVSVKEIATGAIVITDVEVTSSSVKITINASSIPAASTYRVSIAA